jgi:hypothetical protein
MIEGMSTLGMHVLRKITFLVLVSLLCLLMAEGFVRLFYGGQILLFPRFHSPAKYGEYTIRRLLPNVSFLHTSVDGRWRFITNSKGFRDVREYGYPKSNGVYRIFCVGDSHTQGFECDQDRTYAAVIGRYLAGRGVVVEVINAGVSGFGTAEELVLVEQELVRYAPDVIVVGFFANDFDDNIKSGLFQVKDGNLVPVKYKHVPASRILKFVNGNALLRWLSQHSYLYSGIFNAAWEWGKGSLLTQQEKQMASEFAVSQGDVDASLRYQKEALCLLLLQRLYAVCERNQIQLVLLDVPQLGEETGGFKSSIPEHLNSAFKERSHIMITSDEVLSEYRHVTPFFLEHGQRHISEITHLLLGVSVARQLHESWSSRKKAGALNLIYPLGK